MQANESWLERDIITENFPQVVVKEGLIGLEDGEMLNEENLMLMDTTIESEEEEEEPKMSVKLGISQQSSKKSKPNCGKKKYRGKKSKGQVKISMLLRLGKGCSLPEVP